jgi:predicted lipid carrier protein YhbT
MSVLATLPLFRNLSVGGDTDIVPRVVSLLRERGRASVLTECVKTLPPELRQTAFANAVDLVFADGRVDEREKRYIDELQAILGIEDELALRIIEVLAIKSRT